MKPGLIVIWNGAVADIPIGWALCDGSNGTPDLRDRFIVGSGPTYPVNDTGGSPDHEHNFTSDGHNHTLDAGDDIKTGFGKDEITSQTQLTGTTFAENNEPLYYASAYIMKIIGIAV